MKHLFTALIVLSLLQVSIAQSTLLFKGNPSYQILPIIRDNEFDKGPLVEHPYAYFNPTFNWEKEAKRTILPSALSFASGVFGGLHEALLWRKDVFFKRFPNADRQYWDNSISWENKYWRRCPVQLSDAYHFTASMHHVLLFSAGISATIPISSSWRKPGKWWHPIARIAMQSAAISAGYYLGSELTFSQFFKR